MRHSAIRSNKLIAAVFILLSTISVFVSCKKDPDVTGCDTCEDQDLIKAEYKPAPFTLELPAWMPDPIIPNDNPLTQQGVALGRMLFYDPVLSSEGISCSSCHDPTLAFTDARAQSQGVMGRRGKRSAMSLANLAFNDKGFFWDGRASTLEAQALIPVEDHLEMDETWENVEKKLREHTLYPEKFRNAFGIDRKSQITKDLVVKALSQFQRTLISANSRYDQVVWLNKGWPTDEEQRGMQLFFLEQSQRLLHPGCSHCHFNPLFGDNTYKNNGIDDVSGLDGFADKGRGGVSMNIYDNGKFRVPTLRNIAVTAPYMHDGRFSTLEQVLDHYSSGGHGVENEDPNIRNFPLSAQDKQDLIAFLNMLTDTSFLNNPAFRNPF